MTEIPFNRPYLVGTETGYIERAVADGWISSGGTFAKRCEAWLEERTGTQRALLTHSCTAALEAAALLTGIGPADEVIMPAFTFVSTANAFAIHGAVPVFVDIRPDTLNLDERLVEAAITPRTRAIAVVHYAGVGAQMDALLDIAERHGLDVIEDAAQGILAGFEGRALGAIGRLGALSFHETKNVTCGEGGALLVNDPELVARAEVLWEKGTNRSQFFRGQVDKYTWVDLGSSFGLGEVSAAFLFGQLERAEAITARRVAIWERYHAAFAPLEAQGLVRRPVLPPGTTNNAHMYYLLLGDLAARTAFIAGLRTREIHAVFHYVPLHTSPAGLRIGRPSGTLPQTTDLADRLVRLPMWAGMGDDDVARVIRGVHETLGADDQLAQASASARTDSSSETVGA